MKLPWDSKARRTKADDMSSRPRSSDIYHTNRWTRLSIAFRNEPEHCLCERCRKRGVITQTEVVDHIIPYPICGVEGFFDRKNLQGLCKRCNIEKGNQDKKAIQEWKRTHPNP